MPSNQTRKECEHVNKECECKKLRLTIVTTRRPDPPTPRRLFIIALSLSGCRLQQRATLRWTNGSRSWVFVCVGVCWFWRIVIDYHLLRRRTRTCGNLYGSLSVYPTHKNQQVVRLNSYEPCESAAGDVFRIAIPHFARPRIRGDASSAQMIRWVVYKQVASES